MSTKELQDITPVRESNWNYSHMSLISDAFWADPSYFLDVEKEKSFHRLPVVTV
jgi:hypothetical protein